MLNGVLRVLIILAVIALCTILILSYLDREETTLTDMLYEMSPDKISAMGLLDDMGVEKLKDISFSQEDGLVKLYLGDYYTEINAKDLFKEEIRAKLGLLGITLTPVSDGTVKIKFNGEPVLERAE